MVRGEVERWRSEELREGQTRPREVCVRSASLAKMAATLREALWGPHLILLFTFITATSASSNGSGK